MRAKRIEWPPFAFASVIRMVRFRSTPFLSGERHIARRGRDNNVERGTISDIFLHGVLEFSKSFDFGSDFFSRYD